MAADGGGERELDLVLLGATGFTGGLVADYLAAHAPAGFRWALAGRSPGRLAAVRQRLAAQQPGCADLALLAADTGDPGGLAALARRTRVLATTVGPYLEHGEPVVAACAEAGTDYCDLTGEPEFVDRMWLAHHATAVRTGARLVHACGFDSIPHDLGARFTVGLLRADVPIRLRGVVRARGTFSGGTFASALTAMSRTSQARQASSQRRRAEPRPEGRSSRAVRGRPHRDPLLGLWLVPLPTIDPVIVARSGRSLAAYGPDFRYAHYAGSRSLPGTVAGVAVVGAVAAAAQVRPLRELLQRRVPQGEGPSAERRAASWFRVDFVAEAGGRTMRTRVSGGDPGYTATATMLAETALCLALDDNPSTAGQVTTAQAMGEHLTGRLQSAGLRFEVLPQQP